MRAIRAALDQCGLLEPRLARGVVLFDDQPGEFKRSEFRQNAGTGDGLQVALEAGDRGRDPPQLPLAPLPHLGQHILL